MKFLAEYENFLEVVNTKWKRDDSDVTDKEVCHQEDLDK